MPRLTEYEKLQTRMALQHRPAPSAIRGSADRRERNALARRMGISEPDPLDVMIIALERERERCLRICDQFPDNLTARHIAKLIREGGQSA